MVLDASIDDAPFQTSASRGIPRISRICVENRTGTAADEFPGLLVVWGHWGEVRRARWQIGSRRPHRREFRLIGPDVKEIRFKVVYENTDEESDRELDQKRVVEVRPDRRRPDEKPLQPPPKSKLLN